MTPTLPTIGVAGDAEGIQLLVSCGFTEASRYSVHSELINGVDPFGLAFADHPDVTSGTLQM